MLADGAKPCTNLQDSRDGEDKQTQTELAVCISLFLSTKCFAVIDFIWVREQIESENGEESV